ncbi:hypothetical protein PPTG_11174 [Phytophthora nicotianae INRA-310]|uniref:HTH CENPB-type domain-containing protein n=1 Tax=Phytophthora nicotianae (strain INRA-310) TaxID=761204 RepID=W2QA47_PHYN3|nr:hypothetical protein PPTG_11174 [Phytophthora nicotianae INRA-310]ETN09145.1 hypothetical protein PPTG_11174 [Phytophthora nicotianae INRA-310]
MVRPTIKGIKKKRKQYKRVRVAYGHKQDVLSYINAGHTPGEALDKFYGSLNGKERRSKQQLISKWRANEAKITVACKSGHSVHEFGAKLKVFKTNFPAKFTATRQLGGTKNCR